MKPFSSVDLTFDKKNEEINGQEFLVEAPSEMIVNSLENSSEQLQRIINDAKSPLIFRITQWICGIAGGVLLIFIIRAITEMPFSEVYGKFSVLFWISGICLITWVILKVIIHRHEKNVLDSDESQRIVSGIEGTEQALFDDLDVPADAEDVDILSFQYKIKNGDIKIPSMLFVNQIYKIFADPENLYLANLNGKYAFPLAEFKAIQTVKKNIPILSWNKDEDIKSEKYKKYKITYNNDIIYCKPYFILEIEHGGELHGIYIPCYELPVFEKFTGLKAQES